MNDLRIIEQNGSAYIDSREVAEIIGKQHKHLLRDIRRYCDVLEKTIETKIGLNDFFVETRYFDSIGRELPCYLITRKGADVIANKLTGEKGILFTALYVTTFHEMAEREQERKIKALKAQSLTPSLCVFNTAVQNVLAGLAQTHSPEAEVLGFLRGAYKPFGIEVITSGCGKYVWTATDIADSLGIYSKNERPHGHAVAAIIDSLALSPGHVAIIPHGVVGITTRYDSTVLLAVSNWLAENNYPHTIPHLAFKYHIYYDWQSPTDYDDFFEFGDSEYSLLS